MADIKRIVQLILDRKSADRVEDEVKKSGKRQTDSLKKNFKALGKVILGVFAVHKLQQFTREMFKLGASVVETGSKFVTVFGKEAADALDGFIEQFAELLALTRTQAREFLATTGAIVQGMGASQDAAADFSEGVLRLAGDLSSFNNVPIEQTFAALRSGLTGEAEPLKRFGIILREADVQARALLDTNKTQASQLTELEKAQARLNLIYEKAGVAVGDLERTQDSQANTVRRVQTRMRQLREEIALKMLPIFSQFLDLIDQGSQDLEGMSSLLGRFFEKLNEFIGGFRILSMELVTFFLSIPPSIKKALAESLFEMAGFVNTAEQIVNRIRRALFQEEISLGAESLIGASVRMLEGSVDDLAKLRRRLEEETAKVVESATVLGGGGGGVTTPRDRGEDGGGGGGGDIFGVGEAVEGQDMAFQTAPIEDFVGTNQTLAENFASAWGNAIDLIQDDFSLLAERGGEVGVALAMGGVEGVKRLAEAKVKENVARAIEEVAKGLGAAAQGNAAGASLHFASAKDHALAAAAWGPLAAGAGAMAGGGGARGAGGGFGPGARFQDTGGRMSEGMNPSAPEVNIFIDPLRANDPAFQRVVFGAEQAARERFGDEARINIRPRSRP